jgi:TRAP-type C4-dicarboxylate transport system permease small subunit
MGRVATRLLVESIPLVFALLIASGGAKLLQGPIESICAPSEANPSEPSGSCAGVTGLVGAILGFFGAIILSLVAEQAWRRRRDRREAGREAGT